jgi:hypothetical protein
MISKQRLKLLEIFLLAQSLDLLTTLVGIMFFEFREMNPSFGNLSILHLAFMKTMVIIIVTKILVNTTIPDKYLKALNIISSLPVFTNTIQLILEVL